MDDNNWLLVYFLNFPWVYVWLCYGYTARTIAGPKLDPQAWLVLFISKKMNFLTPDYEPGPAKRTAQLLGAVLAITSTILYFIGHHEAANWTLSVLFVFAILQAFHGYCGSCMMFYAAALVGAIPESIQRKYKIAFVVKKT